MYYVYYEEVIKMVTKAEVSRIMRKVAAGKSLTKAEAKALAEYRKRKIAAKKRANPRKRRKKC